MAKPETLSIVTLVLTTRQIMHHAQRLWLFQCSDTSTHCPVWRCGQLLVAPQMTRKITKRNGSMSLQSTRRGGSATLRMSSRGGPQRLRRRRTARSDHNLFLALLKQFFSVWQRTCTIKSVLYEVVISWALGKRQYQTYVFGMKTSAVFVFSLFLTHWGKSLTARNRTNKKITP